MNKQNLIDLFKRHLTDYQAIATGGVNMTITLSTADHLTSAKSVLIFIQFARFLSDKFVPNIINLLEQADGENVLVVENIQKYRNYHNSMVNYLKGQSLLSLDSLFLLEDLPSDAEKIASEPLLNGHAEQHHLTMDSEDVFGQLDVIGLLEEINSSRDGAEPSEYYFNDNIEAFARERKLSEDLKSLGDASKTKQQAVHYFTPNQYLKPPSLIPLNFLIKKNE